MREVVITIGVLLLLLLIAGLSGCDTLRYANCLARDNTSRPCN